MLSAMDDAHRFAHEAMATTFEVFVAGEDRAYAGQAADAAFAAIDQVEQELSAFIESSDVARINRLDAGQAAPVGLHALACLQAATKVARDTGGAFDVTIGPLMACWRNPDKSPRQPAESELAAARARVGMGLLEIDEAARTVRVKTAGVRVDLGGIGKGYALDCAAGLFEDWGIASVLLNAGGSTVLAVEPPPGKPGWPVGVGGVGDDPLPPETLALRRKALSGSGIAIKGRHIMDPHTGKPVDDKRAAWSLCTRAVEADALSTAFMVMTPEAVEQYCRAHPGVSALLVMDRGGEAVRRRFGPW